MTEDLITDLSKISGMFVVARNSSFVFKGQPVDIREVARRLGVRYVLEGSVRKAGSRVRINVQLMHPIRKRMASLSGISRCARQFLSVWRQRIRQRRRRTQTPATTRRPMVLTMRPPCLSISGSMSSDRWDRSAASVPASSAPIRRE